MLTIKEATSISVKLANKVYIYLVTASKLIMESTIKPYTETNLFAYSTAITAVL